MQDPEVVLPSKDQTVTTIGLGLSSICVTLMLLRLVSAFI